MQTQTSTHSQPAVAAGSLLASSLRYRPEEAAATCCPVVELRQYMLHPGQRDTLIELFDREFLESQETTGMTVIGQFRDLDDPDCFVWLRGFADMPSRLRALNAFYGGPVWKKHRQAANATMIDSDNVLLLRPARRASGFMLESVRRAAPGARGVSHGLLAATIYYIDVAAAEFTAFFEAELRPLLHKAGAGRLSYFVTENSPNNYPALPVREGEAVFIWFTLFEDQLAHARFEEALRSLEPLNQDVMHGLARRIHGRPDRLRLAPTARSRLHA